MRIIAYTYEANTHCPECAFNRAAVGLLKRQPPLQPGTDEHGLALDLIDSEGNPVRPVFSTDEQLEPLYCGDCGEEIK